MKKVFLLGLVFICGCALQNQKKEHDEDVVGEAAEISLIKAQRHQQSGNLPAALLEYESILTGQPNDWVARAGRASIQLKMGDIDSAKSSFQLLLDSDECAGGSTEDTALDTVLDSQAKLRCSFVWNSLGIIADIRSEFQKVDEYYQAALGLADNQALYYNNYGYSLLMQQRYVEALGVLERGLELAPTSGRIRNNLAIALAWKERYDEAITLYQGDDHIYQGYNNIGYIAMLNGDYKQAIRFFNRALELSPTYYQKAAINLEKARSRLAP